jgi:hypothetical protein
LLEQVDVEAVGFGKCPDRRSWSTCRIRARSSFPFRPGSYREVTFRVEAQGAVIEIREANSQQVVVHHQNLGVDVDVLAPLVTGVERLKRP